MKALKLMAALTVLLTLTALVACGGGETSPENTRSATAPANPAETSVQEPVATDTVTPNRAEVETATEAPALPEKAQRPAATEEPKSQKEETAAEPTKESADPIKATLAPGENGDPRDALTFAAEPTRNPNWTPVPTPDVERSFPTATIPAQITETPGQPWFSDHIDFETPSYKDDHYWDPADELEGIFAAASHATVVPGIRGYGESWNCGMGAMYQLLRAFAVVDKNGTAILLTGGVEYQAERRDYWQKPIVLEIEWSSSDSEVLRLRKKTGEIQAICSNPGTTTVTAKLNGTEASVEFRVGGEIEVLQKRSDNCQIETPEGTRYLNRSRGEMRRDMG